MKRTISTVYLFASAALILVAVHTTQKAAIAGTNSSTTTASASAVVVSPISVAKNQDLDFGSFTISGLGSISSGGITDNTVLVPEGNLQKNAIFTVGGESGYSYSVEIPVSMISVIDNNDTEITVVGPDRGRILYSGADQFEIEGILNVNGDEAPGTYTSQSFDVNVSYE